MRIISGKLGGRRLNPPLKQWKTRPTTDRAKESLFNILNHQFSFEGKKVLDLYSGTGNIGFEFLSRGASEVVFVDRNPACCKFIRSMAALFDMSDQVEIYAKKASKAIRHFEEPFDFIFADPPYGWVDLNLIIDEILEIPLLEKNGILIVEHDHRHNFSNHVNNMDERKYGDSFFSFFQLVPRSKVNT